MTRVTADDTETTRAPSADRQRTVVSRLTKLVQDNRELIEKHQPRLPRNCSGYHLRSIIRANLISLPRLLVGSEGTLGLFTEASLHTMKMPEHRGAVLLLFGDLEGAVAAVQAIAKFQPSACDLLDRRLLSLGRDADPRFAAIIPAMAEAAVLVEQTDYSDKGVQDRIDEIVRKVRALNPRARVAMRAFTTDDIDFLWSLPSRVVPLLTGLEASHDHSRSLRVSLSRRRPLPNS